MSANIVPLNAGPRAPADLPDVLRRMAADMEAGRITSMVYAAVMDGEYIVGSGASLNDGLILATLLHRNAVDKFIPPEYA